MFCFCELALIKAKKKKISGLMQKHNEHIAVHIMVSHITVFGVPAQLGLEKLMGCMVPPRIDLALVYWLTAKKA